MISNTHVVQHSQVGEKADVLERAGYAQVGYIEGGHADEFWPSKGSAPLVGRRCR